MGDEVCIGDASSCLTAVDTGCPLGTWPSPWAGGACVPAGGADPDAPPASPRWCVVHDVPGACAAGAEGCPAGEVPGDEGCQPAGPAWSCPPGFREVPGDGALPDCEPDPDDCLPWEETPGAIHVNGANRGAALGTYTNPYTTLSAALQKAPSGATIVVAAGTYAESIVLDRPVTIRGRCAAQVTLVGGAQVPVIFVPASATAGPARIERLRIRNATNLVAPGRGVVAYGPLELHLERCWLDALRLADLYAGGEGVNVTIVESLVSRVSPQTAPTSYVGIGAFKGASLTVERSRITRCWDYAVAATGEGSALVAHDIVIDAAIAADPASGKAAVGMAVDDGATADVDGALIADTAGVGISVSRGATLRARGAVVLRTDGPDKMTYAAVLADEADLQLSGCRLGSTLGVGISAVKSTVRAVGVLIEEGRPEPPAYFGGGILALGGSTFEVIASRVTDCTNWGIGVGVDTVFTGVDVLVDGTRAYGTGESARGIGLEVSLGAHAVLQGSRFTGNAGGGIYVSDGGVFAGEGVQVDGTQVAPDGLGMGLAIRGSGSKATLAGSRIRGTSGLGLYTFNQGRSGVAGVSIEATSQGEALDGGTGVLVASDGTLDMRASQVAESAVAGVAFNAGGSGAIAGSVIRRSTGGQYQSHGSVVALGDGVVVDASADVELRDSVVTDNVRAGLFVVSGGTVIVTTTAAVRNLYGVVIEAKEVVEGLGNAVFGNSVQDFIGNGTLVIAPPPEVAFPELPSAPGGSGGL